MVNYGHHQMSLLTLPVLPILTSVKLSQTCKSDQSLTHRSVLPVSASFVEREVSGSTVSKLRPQRDANVVNVISPI